MVSRNVSRLPVHHKNSLRPGLRNGSRIVVRSGRGKSGNTVNRSITSFPRTSGTMRGRRGLGILPRDAGFGTLTGGGFIRLCGGPFIAAGTGLRFTFRPLDRAATRARAAARARRTPRARAADAPLVRSQRVQPLPRARTRRHVIAWPRRSSAGMLPRRRVRERGVRSYGTLLRASRPSMRFDTCIGAIRSDIPSTTFACHTQAASRGSRKEAYATTGRE